jgi:acetamidase/formamidase
MHIIEPNETTLHGYFSNELAPILTIQSGEMVRYKTLAANWSEVRDGKLVQLPLREQDPLKGHGMCGPIVINGAKKGMVLEVQIGDIVPDTKGYNRGGGSSMHVFQWMGTTDGEPHLMDWTIDVAAGTATAATGHSVKISPFMGVMGVAPAEAGIHDTAPPRVVGGNLDCKELLAGTSLYLPIAVDGALFSVGDGHARQGDGEISGTAIECPMERVDLTFIVHEEMSLTTPAVQTPEGWITFGFSEDLDEAANIACNAMLDTIMKDYSVSRQEALALASVVVDLRVTQIVNGVKGVHAVLPHGALF